MSCVKGSIVQMWLQIHTLCLHVMKFKQGLVDHSFSTSVYSRRKDKQIVQDAQSILLVYEHETRLDK